MSSPSQSASLPLENDAPIHVTRRARFEILFAVLLGLFLSALDQTIVGPILPRVVTDLHGADYYTWVVTAYLLTSTVTVPIYGKLSDLYGRRPMLMVGIGLFLVGSALSGLSQTMWQLILFRGIQGLGAGALFPISLAVIGDLFSPAERGKYQGLFGAVFGVAFLVGPGLGGFLTDTFSWHWVFYVNLPIGLVALTVIWRLLPTVRRSGARPSIDWLGVATFTAAVVPILVGLTNAQSGNWSDPRVWGLLVAGFVFGAVFIWVESRAREPMIPLDLFRVRTFAVSMVAVFLAMFGFFSAVIFLPLWFQVVKGASATASGYDLLPFLFGLIGSSIVAGQVVSRTGHYKWLTSASLLVAAIGLLLLTNVRADTPVPLLWIWMLMMGIGIGPTMAVFTIIVQNAVPFSKLGAATSDLTLFRQIGGTVGLTLGFTLFRGNLNWDLIRQQLMANGLPSQFVPVAAPAGFDPGALTQVGSGAAGTLSQVPPQFRAAFATAFHEAFSIALANALWLGVGAMALAVISTLLLHELPLRRQVPGQAEQRGAMPAFE
ncbi:MAG: MFS transporter [Chloroflexi bacterium]|nr:MAG: MFS transporter [Chloroflexota bacterium]